MTAERLREIRERLEGASPGAWSFVGDELFDGNGELICSFIPDDRYSSPASCQTPELPDQVFIESAPSDIRWLLERVEELEREKAVADAYEAGKKANDDIKNGRLRTFDSVDEMLASFNEPLEGGMDSDD